jgi:MarR family transcriptional regulator, lower aerobic nicotinate degradation pathway regulator
VDSPRRLTGLPSWLSSQVALEGGRLVGEALGAAGLRRHHYAVLTALAEQGATSQAELGRRLWIDRSDLHAALNELEGRGWLARVRDEQDRRRNLVELTAAGTEELRALDAKVDAAQDALLAPLSAAERRELVALLSRVVAAAREA